MDKRHLIVSEKLSGKSLLEISTLHNISYSTVKRIWSLYRKSGKEGLIPKYDNCGQRGTKYYKFYRLSMMLKRKYPNCGSPYILTILSKRYANEPLPSERTLQSWFSSLSLNKPKLERPQQKSPEVKSVHDCWQIDAKENIQLKDGKKYSYLTTVDVIPIAIGTGIALEAPVFSLR